MRYNRFFAFGCSFTSWHWPTWADIIGQHFPQNNYYNLGICASGNEFAFHRLTEAHARYNITKDDLVIICWTNFAREDRYLNGAWQTAGNIFTQDFYPKEWVEKWFDLRGALLKTSSFVAGATHLLDSIGCKYVFTSMMPMQQLDEFDIIFADSSYDDIFTLYKKYYDQIQPSMVEYLYGKNKWTNPKGINIKWSTVDESPWIDSHPNPIQALKYTNEIIVPHLTDFLISTSTVDWINQWQQELTKDKFYVCDKDGWTFNDRWQRFHGKMC